jgi:hypothetical protein
MNISLNVILRLGEESSMSSACGRAHGFFAEPQNDKPGVQKKKKKKRGGASDRPRFSHRIDSLNAEDAEQQSSLRALRALRVVGMQNVIIAA